MAIGPGDELRESLPRMTGDLGERTADIERAIGDRDGADGALDAEIADRRRRGAARQVQRDDVPEWAAPPTLLERAASNVERGAVRRDGERIDPPVERRREALERARRRVHCCEVRPRLGVSAVVGGAREVTADVDGAADAEERVDAALFLVALHPVRDRELPRRARRLCERRCVEVDAAELAAAGARASAFADSSSSFSPPPDATAAPPPAAVVRAARAARRRRRARCRAASAGRAFRASARAFE